MMNVLQILGQRAFIATCTWNSNKTNPNSCLWGSVRFFEKSSSGEYCESYLHHINFILSLSENTYVLSGKNSFSCFDCVKWLLYCVVKIWINKELSWWWYPDVFLLAKLEAGQNKIFALFPIVKVYYIATRTVTLNAKKSKTKHYG